MRNLEIRLRGTEEQINQAVEYLGDFPGHKINQISARVPSLTNDSTYFQFVHLIQDEEKTDG